MHRVDQAANVLRQAEATIRGLVSDAATTGDYDAVVQLTAWARAVSEILKAAPLRTDGSIPWAGASQEPTRERRAVAARGTRNSRDTPREKYPRFFREADRLVRVAWSKREKKEYEHKAPYAVLRALGAAMVEKGTDGRLFSTDQILPIYDDDGALIPSYQAYVAIALIKHAGLIDQHGRRGYSIPRLTEFKNAVEAVWRDLPGD